MQPLRLVSTYPQGIHVYQCQLCGCVSADIRPVDALGCDCDTDDHEGDCLGDRSRQHDSQEEQDEV